ncbi:MAG: hypothetical protein QXP98_02940 [Thermoproteus sp.]
MADSNVLLVTLWAKPESVLAALPEDVRKLVAAATALYSKDGVNYLLASLAERLTAVDTVIIFGPDLTGSGQALVDALEGRCGEWARIPCEAVRELGLRVVDLRDRYGDYEALAEAVRSSYRPRAPRAPKPLPIRPPEGGLGYVRPVGWGLAYDVSPRYLWVKVLDYVATYGFKEGAVLKASVVAQLGLWGAERVEAEGPAGLCDVEEVRRAVSGGGGAGGGRCLVLSAGARREWAVLDLLIRDADLAELRREIAAVASAFVDAARSAGLKPGIVSYLLLDVRAPLDYLEKALEELGRELASAYSREVYDPRGNFVLAGGSLLHYTTDGVLHRALEADRRAALREAAKLLPDHAFYLGEELAAMKILGERYRQEEWRGGS